jgi:hypothetical protein
MFNIPKLLIWLRSRTEIALPEINEVPENFSAVVLWRLPFHGTKSLRDSCEVRLDLSAYPQGRDRG